MKISGFTFVKNAGKLFIPAKESISSILSMVDEFVVVLGDCDDDDSTEKEILSLNSEKIKIIHSKWESEKYPKNTIFAHQTDLAKEACTGDWLFYLQCDEALHEQYIPTVKAAINKYHKDQLVEGLVFRYKHFWGDFEHYNPSHTFYSKEIRIIRNLKEIHSWKDAQSFRYHQGDFNYQFEDYQRKEGTRKLNVALIDAEIYHYGWVRPPAMMNKKRKTASTTYHGKEAAQKKFEKEELNFDYGPLNRVRKFKGSHPSSFKNWLKKMDWENELQYNGKRRKKSQTPKHEKLKYRILTWLESRLLGGRRLGEFQNFNKIR
tara:strand:+ start:197 stop:1153 length:957 start_codon:yes stop_codon:yes gene_type:complete